MEYNMGEKTIFLKNFIKKPRMIGSVIPSSRKLSKKMASQINYDNANCILELGPGVGPYTDIILKKKKSSTKYFAFEKNEDMVKILKKKFPDIKIYNKAEQMTDVIRNDKIEGIDYIISGLPFTVLEKDIRNSILEQSYDNLEKGGKFITFQYSLDLYKYLKNKYSKVEIKFVPLSITMTFVYVCTK